MSWVRTYNPSVRVGNWTEDLVLEEDQIKEFLEKKENNQLLIQKATNLLKKLLKPEDISNTTDGYLHIGDTVCLMHKPSQSVLSGYMSAFEAQEALQLLTDSRVTGSTRIQPCPRNVFIVGSYDDSTAKIGDVVKYEQLITFTTLPGTGGELTLESDTATAMDHAKYTREQELKLTDRITYKSAWKVMCFNPEERLESTGMPVPTNEVIFINHSKTNNNLAIHTNWKPRTPFGHEYEATACTKYNIHRIEDTHNHFMIVTGDYIKKMIEEKE